MMLRVRWWIESVDDTRPILSRASTAWQLVPLEAGIERPFATYDQNLKSNHKDATRFSDLFRVYPAPDSALGSSQG